jgi:hypothetical protein
LESSGTTSTACSTLLLELLELAFLDPCLDRLAQLLRIGLAFALVLLRFVALALLRPQAGLLQGALALTGDRAGLGAAGEHRDRQRRLEVIGDALELGLVDRGQQPHQQEEGHHGRHEVGVGDLPGAAVVARGRPS